MSTTHLEHIKAKLDKYRKYAQFFVSSEDLEPQLLNLLSIIEAQAEALAEIKRHSSRCDVCGASSLADDNLEQTCKLLGVGNG